MVTFLSLINSGSRHAIYSEFTICFFFLFSTSVGISEKIESFFYFIIKTILYGIWVFRNRATFQNGREDRRAIIKFISSDISMRVRLDQFRLTEYRFNDLWSLSSFCAIESGRISLNLQ